MENDKKSNSYYLDLSVIQFIEEQGKAEKRAASYWLNEHIKSLMQSYANQKI